MSDADLARRMQRLKKHPTVQGQPDGLLEVCLDDALAFFYEYTHRVNDPGQIVDSLVCELAILKINAEGVQNVKVAKEGEVEREWYETIPPMLVNRLKSYRLMWGVNAEHVR